MFHHVRKSSKEKNQRKSSGDAKKNKKEDDVQQAVNLKKRNEPHQGTQQNSNGTKANNDDPQQKQVDKTPEEIIEQLRSEIVNEQSKISNLQKGLRTVSNNDETIREANYLLHLFADSVSDMVDMLTGYTNLNNNMVAVFEFASQLPQIGVILIPISAIISIVKKHDDVKTAINGLWKRLLTLLNQLTELVSWVKKKRIVGEGFDETLRMYLDHINECTATMKTICDDREKKNFFRKVWHANTYIDEITSLQNRIDSDLNRRNESNGIKTLLITENNAKEIAQVLEIVHRIDRTTKQSQLDNLNTIENLLASFSTCAIVPTRNFSQIARSILSVVDKLKEPGTSTILKVISGKQIDSYRYKSTTDVSKLAQTIRNELLPKKYTMNQFREFITILVSKQYLYESTKSGKVKNHTKSWTIYKLSPKGRNRLQNISIKIMLPVPESILEAERLQEIEKVPESILEAERLQEIKKVEDNGVSRQKLPQDEIETGDGEVIRAYSKWYSYIEKIRKQGEKGENNNEETNTRKNVNDKIVNEGIHQLERLVESIQEWRSKTAVKYRMAPGSVLPEHILISIAYTTATLPAGLKIDKHSLYAAGVRTRELDSLVSALDGWLTDVQRRPSSSSIENVSSRNSISHRMVFPNDGIVKPSQKWEYAIYKAQKKTGLASWESSYIRFQENGESLQSIAMSPSNGRPIQVTTVIGHIQEALLYGRPVNLRRLYDMGNTSPLPTKEQWMMLENAEKEMEMSVCGDPLSSGMNGEKFTMTDFLRPIMGERFADIPFTDRTQEQKDKFSMWCNLLKWYMNLKRANITPEFE